ncbi:MAG: hypothetical protein A2660_03135 [Candidatus Doudnabacteria bacterium RIFCSPHIGHO2_01_FULL_45_18]|uniref:UmuC domain-containing protein n=1 Tax=Candidatus Doudnabacteria bacterium RIFCSPHIGHO2_01_FULL_45_18 TaxID=1817823 RepID=A0A1F5NRZ5_9BACT|nr:MAG: hypothetical protein A2660_03135 [Candidatus Doudnabacteria bacterium RIFCSPHIGHO2_01_FULL_45_18]
MKLQTTNYKLLTLPRIMLVDMNSFFASVEQQANPFLRGRPLGVSPRLASTSDGESRRASSHPTSCLIGTSKEAKALGIKNGIPLYKARKICPEIMVIESEPEKYREINRQINRIFLDYTSVVETYSVDESFLDFRESKLNPLLVGAEIKKRIKQEVGEWLTCSVGVASNKFMAKLAADLEKPDGLSVVWRENLPAIYEQKKFTDLWGINRGWANRFQKLGIQGPKELLDYPVQNLISIFGKPGFYIWQRVQGLEEDVIQNYEHDPKSFGHSWVLNFRTTHKEQLKIVILRLAEKAARRMRREGFAASGMYLSIRLVDGNHFHRSKKLQFQIETGLELYREAMAIWQHWNFQLDVMHIAVGFTSLLRKTKQLELFVDKQIKLMPALDLINDKYGEFAIRSGLLTHTQDFAPDAIAFGK